MGECLLCERSGKGKRIKFYSGVKKGGTTHRMLSCTVTIYERWSELTMHEATVCRECLARVWKQKHSLPTMLFGVGAAATALLGLLALVLLGGADSYVVPGLALVATLTLGGLFAYTFREMGRKPEQAELDPLVLAEALPNLPHPDHTYLTSEQYVERYRMGVIS